MEPLRSLMFIPSNRPNFMEKAGSLPADVLVLDLEDSVPVAEKGAGRELVRRSMRGLVARGQRVYVRINSLVSGLWQDDLQAVVVEGLSGISLPKAGSAEDVLVAARAIEALERERGLEPGRIRLIPWLETALGLVHAFQISSASPRVIGVAFGADDFTSDMGIERTREGTEQFYPRCAIAIPAHAAGVMALDTPYTDFKDEAGLVRDAKLARGLGFLGKFTIHPTQIEPVNNIFRPSDAEVAQARKVVQAFEAAEAQGHASTSLEGKMIDIAVILGARKLLQVAEAIARRERAGPSSS